MKKKFYKIISYLLIAGMTMTTFSSIAMAEEIVETTGEGTPETPAITKTTNTETDENSGETTITIEIDKKWENETVEGRETVESTDIYDKKGKIISSEGSAQGSETTIIETSDKGNEEEITTDNGKGETEGGLNIESEVPNVTIVLTPGGKDEKSENADAWFDEDKLDISEWIRKDDGEGTKWITDGSSKEENGIVTNVTVENVGSDTTYTRKITDTDGKIREEKVIFTRDANGRITGYRTEISETVPATTEETTPPENAEISAEGGKTSYEFKLPEKPIVSEPEKDSDGNVLNGQVVAELRNGDGNVVGYTVVTIEDGKAVYFSDPVMGGYVSIATKIEKTEDGLKKYITTETTLTKNNYSEFGSEVEGGERIVSGQMGDVIGNTIFDNGSFSTYVPGLSNLGTGNVDPRNELYNRQTVRPSIYDINGQYFQWLGTYGIESMIRVKAGDVDTWQPHQFILEGKNQGVNEKYYVYCADFEVNPKPGANYNMNKLEDAGYIGKEEAEKMRSIVLNGYWGVSNVSNNAESPTPGSLDAFKKMLTDAGVLTAEQAANLTDGMAITATQAAIWHYGNSGEVFLNAEDIVGKYYLGGQSFKEIDPNKKAVINNIYKYLINMEGTPADASNTLITKDDFAKRIELTVKEKQADGKYNTDITITMAAKLDDKTSDLLLYVSADNENIDVYRLSGTATEGEKLAEKNSDGSYKLTGLMLKDGTPITLNLKGTQHMENGVYLFTCNTDIGNDSTASQTFIGAGQSYQEIDLNVNFKFNVKEPVVKVRSHSFDSESEMIEWTASHYLLNEEAHDDEPEEEPEEEPEDEPEDEPEENHEEKSEEKPEEKPKEEPKEEADGKIEDNSIKKEEHNEHRNTDVPKTGDNLYELRVLLMAGIIISLITAFVCYKKKEEV